MKQRKYFEMLAYVGKPTIPDKDFPYDTETLLSDMAYARIHGAACIYNVAKNYSYELGNREAIKLAQENDRLYGLALVPSTAHIETNNAAYYEELLSSGIRGLAMLFGSPLASSMEPRALEKIVQALIAYKRPLIALDVVNEERISKVHKLAQAFPELPIILQGSSWGAARLVWEALEANDNLYFDIVNQHANNFLEYTKKYFGTERALYSSIWPNKSMGGMKSLIEYADISEADKDLVAYGNACRLFGISPDALELYADSDCQLDEISAQADAGEPISVPVIDCHSHVVGKDCAISYLFMPNPDAESMVKKMDLLGIDTTISAPWSGIQYDGVFGNEEVLEAGNAFPGRFLAYSCCNVHYEEDRQQVTTYHDRYPEYFVGIKPYPPFFKFALTDDCCKPWLEYANAHHLTALIHSGGPEKMEEQVDEIADQYPDLVFILAHSGQDFNMARKFIDIANRHKNVVLDITYTSTSRNMVEFLAEGVGADRVLFATDFPMRDPSPQLGWVCYAKLSVEDKKKILAGNVQRLLDRRI